MQKEKIVKNIKMCILNGDFKRDKEQSYTFDYAMLNFKEWHEIEKLMK